MEDQNADNYIRCVGVDNKQHVCLPWEDKCKCGVKVKRKEMLDRDWQLFGCYECTY